MLAHEVETALLIDVQLSAIIYGARDIKFFELRTLDGQPLPAAAAGAHIDLHLPNGMCRQYSLISPNERPTRYLVGIKRDPGGRGGSQLAHDALRVGSILRISRPRNNFPLVEDAELSTLIAGGIGITPIWSMVQRLQVLGKPWRLYYSSRSRRDAVFLDELSALRDAHCNFDDAHGLLNIEQIVASVPPYAHLYCCGPAGLLRAFESATSSRPRGHIHVEYFAPAAAPAFDGEFTVGLARSGGTYVIPAGVSILQLLRDAGVCVAWSCEQGVCGSCETVVLGGIPDHRDMVLTELGRALNDKAMICCARCRSGHLVLDL